MKFRVVRRSAVPGLALLVWSAAVSQAPAAGLAAIKEQPFHEDTSAVVLPFTRIIDSGGPYLKIVAEEKESNITRSMLVCRLDLIGEVPQEIRTDRGIAPVRSCLADMRAFAARFPGSRPVLEPKIRSLEEHVRHFEAGKVRHAGQWIPAFDSAMIQAREQVGMEAEKQKKASDESRDPSAPAKPDLGAEIAVLEKPGMDEARQAVARLEQLASCQEFAARTRTLRLATVIRNLFSAEFRLKRAEKTYQAAEVEAARQRKSAAEWATPNKFGSVNDVPAAEALQKAEDILRKAGHHVDEHRKDLLAQLQEADSVLQDFRKLGEDRVVLVLTGTMQAITSRSLPEDALSPGVAETTVEQTSAGPPQDPPPREDPSEQAGLPEALDPEHDRR